MSANRTRLARLLQGDGIEIGALHRPLPLPPGARATYVDHLDEAGLRAHYPELGDVPFAPVSILGTAEDLSAIADESVDFVIANHLLEHLEYPLRGLQEFQRVLKPRGILFLALPDQRQTFDVDRTLTPAEHIFEEHEQGTAGTNRRAHYLDWAVNVDRKQPGPEAEAHADDLLARHYSIHFHVWRADSFLDLLVEARRRLPLDFAVVAFSTPSEELDNEFIFLLGRGRDGAPWYIPEPETVAVPEPPSPTLRRRLAESPVGPPVRAVKRALKR